MALNSCKEFVKQYEEHRTRLFNLISELHRAQRQFKDAEDKVRRGRTAAAATSSAGVAVIVLGLVAAPFTFGTSLALLGVGAAATVSGAGAKVGVEVTHNHEIEKAQKNRDALMEDFIQKIEAVQDKLLLISVYLKTLAQDAKHVWYKVFSAVSSKSIWALKEALDEVERIYKTIYRTLWSPNIYFQ